MNDAQTASAKIGLMGSLLGERLNFEVCGPLDELIETELKAVKVGNFCRLITLTASAIPKNFRKRKMLIRHLLISIPLNKLMLSPRSMRSNLSVDTWIS